jgi:hypothetical protein
MMGMDSRADSLDFQVESGNRGINRVILRTKVRQRREVGRSGGDA